MKISKAKRFFALVLSGIMMISLVACGKKEEVKQEEPVVQEESGKEGELDFVNLRWYYYGEPSEGMNDVFAKANEIIKNEINAEVEFVPIPQAEYAQKMQLIDSSGGDYDLCWTSNWLNDYVTNVAKGAYLPLDDLISEYAPTASGNIPEKFWNATKVEGQIYGFINYQISVRTPQLVFNKDLAEKHGYDPYTDFDGTMESLEPYLKKLRQDDPTVFPFEMEFTSDLATVYGIELPAGESVGVAVRIDDEEMKAFNLFESEEYKEYFDLMRDWSANDYIRSEDVIVTEYMTEFSNGNAAVWSTGTYKPGVEQQLGVTYGQPVACVKLSEPFANTSGVTATLTAISRNSKNPERAMMLLELINTNKELYNLLVYGIEGENYTKLDGNFIKVTEGSNYSSPGNWKLGCAFNAFLLEGNPENTWEETAELNMSAKESPLMGFNFSAEPVNTQIAQCSSVYEQYKDLLNNGLVTDAQYEEFLGKMEKAGVQDIIAEVQAQIDAWAATK